MRVFSLLFMLLSCPSLPFPVGACPPCLAPSALSDLLTNDALPHRPTAAAVAAPAASSADSGVVSMADDKFSEWLASSPANEKAWEQSLDDPKSYE